MVPLPFLLVTAQGDFSLTLNCENPIELLEVKLTKVWEPHYDWAPLEFLTVRIVHTETPAIRQFQFRFSCSGTGSLASFCPPDSAQLSHDSLYSLV